MIRNNKESAFTIVPLPTNCTIKKEKEKTDRHDYKEIILFFSGEGEFKIDDEIINLKPNTLFFIQKKPNF